MIFAERRIKSEFNEGCIWLCLYLDGRMSVNVIDLHGDGEAWVDVECLNQMGLYENIRTVFNTMTHHLAPQIGIDNQYEDTVIDTDGIQHPLTPDTVKLISSIDAWGRPANAYVSKGCVDKNDIFVYDALQSNKPI
jgi:hypothetical protein